jgi:sRNA-binding carbon storage regulator CsrA
MHEQWLEVGEELVIGGGISLTLLAVEAGEVLLGVTAPEPSDVAGPEAGDRLSSGTQGGAQHPP